MAPERETSGVVEPPALVIEVPLFRVRRGLRLAFRTEGQPISPATDSTATKNLLLAHRWHQALETGEVQSSKELAARLGVSQPRVSMMLSLVFLAPDLQEETLGLRERHRLDTLGLQALLGLARLHSWESQRAALAEKMGKTVLGSENNRGGNRA